MSDVKVKSFVPQAINGNAEGTLKGMQIIAMRVTAQTKKFANYNKGYQTGQAKGSFMWKGKRAQGGGSISMPLRTPAPLNGFIVGSRLRHTSYLEVGTRYMAAQPSLRPGVETVTRGTSAELAMSRAMNDSVKRAI